MRLELVINGQRYTIDGVLEDRRLLDVLREDLHLTGTKEGCGEGECGACTIIMNNEIRLACLTTAIQANNSEILTIEGLEKDGKLAPIQEIFMRSGAVQCGFCTPGFLISAYHYLKNGGSKDVDSIRHAVSGNFCRCTGYSKIIDGIQESHDLMSFEKNENSSKNSEKEATFIDLTTEKKQNSINSNKKNIFSVSTKEELCEFLKKYGSEAGILAGATDIIPSIRKGGEKRLYFADVSKIKSQFSEIVEDDKNIYIGAMATFKDIQHNPIIKKHLFELVHAAKTIGGYTIQAMGTIGGNIANGSPAADSVPALLIYDATIELTSLNSKREIKLSSFYLGYKKMDIMRGEFISKIVIEKKQFISTGFEEVGSRKAVFISKVSLAHSLKDEELILAAGSVSAFPKRLLEVEKIFLKQDLTKDTLLEYLSKDVIPLDDIRSTGEYRQKTLLNLLWSLRENLLKK
ncbi:FAD binding domain-containing protein [bacterium]|nr:FAD binding domain-containing protein [bacterium]